MVYRARLDRVPLAQPATSSRSARSRRRTVPLGPAPRSGPLVRPRCCHPLRRGLDAAAASVCFVAWSLACATHHKCVSALASALLASISLRWRRDRCRSRRRCVATPPALPSSPLRSHPSATRRTREPIHVVKRARSTHRLCPCHRATRPACAGSRAMHLAAHAATTRTTRAGETPPAAPKCVPTASSGQARVAFDPPLPFGLCSGAGTKRRTLRSLEVPCGLKTRHDSTIDARGCCHHPARRTARAGLRRRRPDLTSVSSWI